MPYGQRNAILISGLLFAGALLLAYIASAVLLFSITGGELQQLSKLRPELTSDPWWLEDLESPSSNALYLWKTVGLFVLLAAAFVAALVLRRLYQRTASAEIFFFLFFLFSLSFESIWSWNAILIHLGSPVLLNVVLSKVTYFGRFFGLLALLTSSLYAIEISQQKFSLLLFTAFLVSLAFIYVLPVDASYLTANFLYGLGDRTSMWLIMGVLEAAVAVNFFIAAHRRERSEFVYAGAAAVVIAVGKELTNLGGPAQILAGVVLLGVGVWLFSSRVYRVYLWT